MDNKDMKLNAGIIYGMFVQNKSSTDWTATAFSENHDEEFEKAWTTYMSGHYIGVMTFRDFLEKFYSKEIENNNRSVGSFTVRNRILITDPSSAAKTWTLSHKARPGTWNIYTKYDSNGLSKVILSHSETKPCGKICHDTFHIGYERLVGVFDEDAFRAADIRPDTDIDDLMILDSGICFQGAWMRSYIAVDYVFDENENIAYIVIAAA